MSSIQLHELDDTGPGLRLSVGVSGSGKTYGLRKQVFRAIRAGVPVMALDRLREWQTLPPDIARLAVGVTPETGVKLAAEWLASGARLVIVQTRDVEKDIVSACEWARDTPGHCGVATSEVHRAAANTGAPLVEALEDVALAWRHHLVSFWCDTQRLSLCHRTLTEQMRELRVYATGGERDLQRLREMGGAELADGAKECARRLLAGEPGWFVRVRTIALPPYTLEREPA
jgi:hypothetical protein